MLVTARLTGAETGSASGPRRDFAVLREVLGATVLDHAAVERSPTARAIARVAGVAAAQAWLALRARRAYDVIISDGEHIGIPLACLLKLHRARVAHVVIGHRIGAAKKRPFFRLLRVQSHISRIALHAQRQFEIGLADLGIPAEHMALIPYQVDVEFWRPRPAVQEERLICSAGLEFRDYTTLLRAVDGLDAQVVIGAASHWSKRRNSANNVPCPPNVQVDAFDYPALRDLYARSALVVVPLAEDTDFQAGVTTILEAMAMGKAVVVTHTPGQTDVVEDRRACTRGRHPRRRPVSLLRSLARETGVELEPSGFYVPPADPEALRRAIVYLLEHPAERRRLGMAGRRTVERLATVDQFAARMRDLVDQALGGATQQPLGPGRAY
jgi:glycosyltransferase involved in cell wall biosynthesis